MGFELLRIEDGDEEKYNIITITSPNKRIPHDFCGVLKRQSKGQKVKARSNVGTSKENLPHMFVPEDVCQSIDKKDKISWFKTDREMEGPGPPRRCVTE